METIRLLMVGYVIFGPVLINSLAPEEKKEDWTSKAFIPWLLFIIYIGLTL